MTNKTNKSYNTNKQNKVQGAMDWTYLDIINWTYLYYTMEFCNNDKMSKNKLNKTNKPNKINIDTSVSALGYALGATLSELRSRSYALGATRAAY